MAQLYIPLLRSTPGGIPVVRRTGPPYHFVLFTDDPRVPVKSQMRAGGLWPQDDCGDTDLACALELIGKFVSVRTIEVLSGTNNEGTNIDYLAATARQLGFPNAVKRVGGVPPSGLYGMNSATDQLVPPGQMGPYYASASLPDLRVYIDLNPGGVITVASTRPTGGAVAASQETPEMFVAPLETPDGVERFYFTNAGDHLVRETVRGPDASGRVTEVTYTRTELPAVTGSGGATCKPGANGNYTIVLCYESVAGRVEAWYDTAVPGWHWRAIAGVL